MRVETHINRTLDALARPRVMLRGRPRAAFKLCGLAGLLGGGLLGLALTWRAGLSPRTFALLVSASAFAFFALAFATKIVAGGERLVYYHHQAGVFASAAYVLWALGFPVLPYLDVVAAALGTFLCCGRVGCLMAGCCYGRPHRWGVRYGTEHAAEGFPACYVGARLFPVQAFEAVWALLVVLTCCLAVAGRRPAGAAFSWYVVAYAAGRFCLEFARGDARRPYLRGFSEAQWTSLLLATAVAAAELSGLLPPNAWHLGAPACLAAAMLLLAAVRRRDRAGRHRLLHPRHVRELAETIQTLSQGHADSPHAAENAVRVVCTSLGILVSAGGGRGGAACHYALSRRDGPMDAETAESLAGLICKLRGRPAAGALLRGRQSVFHLLLSAGPPAGGAE